MKYFFIILFFITCLINETFSQKTNWTKGFGSWVDDNMTVVATDKKEGFLYIAGHTGWEGAIFGNDTSKFWGIFISKQDTLGNVIWNKFYECTFDNPLDITIDTQGNILVTGYVSNYMNFGQNSMDYGGEAFVVKFTKDGDFVFVKYFGTLHQNKTYPKSITTDKNNNIYIAAIYNHTSVYGNDTIYNTGNFDISILKFDSLGNYIFSKRGGGVYDDDVYDIVVDSNLNIYVAGIVNTYQCELFDSIYNNAQYEYKTFISKLDSLGLTQWTYFSETDGNNSQNAFTTIKIDNKQDIVAYGYYNAKLSSKAHIIAAIDSVGFGNFIAKISSEGKPIWVKYLNNLSDNGNNLPPFKIGDMCIDEDNNIYVGTDYAFNLVFNNDTITSLNNFRDIVIIKLNEVGYPQWIQSFTGGYVDFIKSIDFYKKNIFVGGNFYSDSLNIDSFVLRNNSGNLNSDMFLIHLIDTTVNKCPNENIQIIKSANNLCGNDSITIKCKSKYSSSFLWFQNNNIFPDNLKEIKIIDSAFYKVIVNKNSVCEDSSNIIYINKYNKPQLDIQITPSEFLCDNDSVTIINNVAEKYNYIWLNNTDFISKDTVQYINVNTIGKYFCIVDNNYCKDSSEIEIKSGMPSSQLISSSRYLYTNDSIQIFTVFDSTYNYVWKWNDSVLSQKSFEIFVNNPGLYTVIVNNNYCSLSDSINIIEIDNLINVFPNPCDRNLKILNINSQKVDLDIEIVDFSGIVQKEMFNIFINTNDIYNINISDLKVGLYFIKLNINGKVYNYKIIKE